MKWILEVGKWKECFKTLSRFWLGLLFAKGWRHMRSSEIWQVGREKRSKIIQNTSNSKWKHSEKSRSSPYFSDFKRCPFKVLVTALPPRPVEPPCEDRRDGLDLSRVRKQKVRNSCHKWCSWLMLFDVLCNFGTQHLSLLSDFSFCLNRVASLESSLDKRVEIWICSWCCFQQWQRLGGKNNCCHCQSVFWTCLLHLISEWASMFIMFQ